MSGYRQALSSHTTLTLNPEPPGTENGFWMPTVVFNQTTGIDRDQIQAAFSAESIDARVFFWPLSGLPAFSSMSRNANASEISDRAINLPSYHDMTTSDLQRVCDVVTRLLEAKSAS